MIIALIVLIVFVHFLMFLNKKEEDFKIQLNIYENQKFIIENQHTEADALILIMKLISMEHLKRNTNGLPELPKIENLPN